MYKIRKSRSRTRSSSSSSSRTSGKSRSSSSSSRSSRHDSDLDSIPECPELTPLEPLSESEYGKLSAANKKLANNLEIMMGNIASIRDSVINLRGNQNSLNSLRRSIRLNTNQIDDVDYEHGHLVGQVVDLQKAVSSLKNESKAIKKELNKKDLAMDEIEKMVKRKNLILSGVDEELGENVFVKVTAILQSICQAFQQKDIDCAYRLGTPSTGKTRELVVELFSKFPKEDILKRRKLLKNHPSTRNIWINEDLPQRTRKTRGVMREIVRRAEEKGIPCAMNGDKIICNNMQYGQDHLMALPIGIRPEDLKTRTEGNRIGFMSEESYLSNFYSCYVTVDGYTFPTAEHAIQYKKSLVCGREDVGVQVKQNMKANEVKMLGDKILLDKEWEKCKVGLVKCIVKQKFDENEELKAKLLNTAGFKLEEASRDRFWGTGVPVYSREFKKPTYSGKNVMGVILEEIRDEELARKSNRKGRVSSTSTGQQTDEVQGATAADYKDHIANTEQNGQVGNDDDKKNHLAVMDMHLSEMSESTLRSMLRCLINTNSSPEVQNLVLLKLGKISANQAAAATPT